MFLVSGVHGEERHGDDTEQNKKELVVALSARIMFRHSFSIFVIDRGFGWALSTVWAVDVSREFFK